MDLERIVILDFGSQYTQLIARRVREQRVYCEIHRGTLEAAKVRELQPRGIILSGGPASVSDPDAPALDPEILDLDVPVLGVCYGMQLLARHFGGEVRRSPLREYGRASIEIRAQSALWQGFSLGGRLDVWMSHGDSVAAVPPGFSELARSDSGLIAAMAEPARRFYGLQFHPEVAHTPHGPELLANFLFDVCGCKPNWTMGSFVERSVADIREKVGSGRVLCGLSGGVDSSVVAALVHRAIGDQLTCVFVDNGLLRKNEAEAVAHTFRDHVRLDLRVVDAADRFLEKLAGVTDPEQKRKIIGREFIAVFEDASQELGEVRFLAQGTLYPDVIESVSFKGPSATIKSHHNVGGLPERMKLALLEPLRELFKDEVRLLGEELGLPSHVIGRHPFPGPGLAVRCVGRLEPERLRALREADAIVEEEIRAAGLYDEIWQVFAVLLPVRSVGVMGDERTYEEAASIRAVTSTDGMTADWVRLPYEVLGRISSRIINEVRGINRVLYDVSSKPPSTIEWE